MLDEGDRAALAGLLLESLEGAPDAEVEAAWAAEVSRRIAQVDAGDVELVDWDEIRGMLQRASGASD